MSELTKHLESAKKYLWDSRNPKLGHANACLDAALAEAVKLESILDVLKETCPMQTKLAVAAIKIKEQALQDRRATNGYRSC